MLVRSCLTHEHREWDQNDQIDVKELVISEVSSNIIQKGDRDELDHGVEFNEFEALERSGKSPSSFS
jgi:hypothetical protein